MSQRAAETVRNRMRIAARRLGTVDPVPLVGELFDDAFSLPLGDPRYGNNALLPGSMPIELSFTETQPNALRFDMELAGPEVSPQARRDATSRGMRRVVHQTLGQQALRWFDQRSEPFRTGSMDGNASFGAFFGASFDENGLDTAKAYYELNERGVGDLPPNLQHAVRTAVAMLPGLQPLFTSIGCGRQRGGQRVYLFQPGELRLLDLEPLMNRLGIGQQLPSLLTALGIVTGGRFVLPAGSTVIGLKDTPQGMEMKLDLLIPATPDPPREMHGLIQMHMADRPESQRALRSWIQALTPDDDQTPGEISVVGAKVSPQMPARLSVYLRPRFARPRRGGVDAHRLEPALAK